MGFLTGKPSSSKDVNNDMLKGALGSSLGDVSGASGMMGSLLGVNGTPQQTTALDNYAHSGGMDFLMNNIQRSVTSSKAAQGLLQSGSYGTALQDRANGLASTYLNQYMQNLMDYGKLGLGAAGVLSDSGKTDKGAKPGLLQALGGGQGIAAAAGAAGAGGGAGAGAAAAAA